MKKIISAVLTASLTLGAFTAFAADTPEYEFNKEQCEEYTVQEMPSYTDVKELSKEFDMLVRLNIITGYEDGTLRPEKTITRAEAAKMLCCTVNNVEMVKQYEESYSREGFERERQIYEESGVEYTNDYSGFDDVPLDSWYHPYVYAAKNAMMCVSGYEDGTFRPENEVTEIEFLTMLESALGYSMMLEAEGGYPDGVLTIAKRLKLIDNPEQVPATRERVSKMLYNALHANIVTVTGYRYNDQTGTMEGEFAQSMTLLEHRYVFVVHAALKKSKELPDKTVTLVTDGDYSNKRAGSRLMLKGNKEYTFTKAFTDIPDGEYDVYIDMLNEENPVIFAVR